MNKVLITGGAGFIGNNLAKRLKEEKDIDCFIFDLPEFDVTSEMDVKMVFSEFKPKIVFHLAGMLGTSELFDFHQRKVIDTNVWGAVNVALACQSHGAKMIYASMPRLWLNPYSITKSAAQDYIKSFGIYRGLKHVNLVISNAYGPEQKAFPSVPYKKIIPTFITKALMNEEIPIYGNGMQAIDMIYINDIVDIMWRSACCERANGKNLDIASGMPLSVNYIAEFIIKATGSESKMVHSSNRLGEIPNTIQHIDVSETKKILKYGKLTPFDVGMSKTIEYYKKLLQYKSRDPFCKSQWVGRM